MISGAPLDLQVPPLPATIPALLRLRATDADRDRLAVRLVDRTTATVAIATYGQLFGRACAVAGELMSRGIRVGDPALLLMETRLEFYDALFGAMLAGAVPVAVYPPASRRTLTSSIAHLERVASKLPARVILTTRRLYGVARAVRAKTASVMAIDRTGEAEARTWPGESLAPDTPVLLQYTSGSLAQPRAVELSTRGIFSNLTAIGAAFGIRDGDVGFSWLPLYHDMGLHAVFFGLIYRLPAVLMSPLDFLAHPAAWLQSISRYRITHSPAPTFGFAFATRRIADADLNGVDLSSWRVAMCGAEPIDPAVVARFSERFERVGFSGRAVMAGYGLAENTVAVSFAAAGEGLRVHSVDADLLRAFGMAHEASGVDAVAIASVGRPISGHDVRIVNFAGTEVDDRTQGEIEVRGPSRMLGYRDDPAATSESFDGEWLRTGDLGYLHGGELYVTGRQKDLIIRGGRNYHPADIERAATVEGVRPGYVVAFARRAGDAGTEALVVVAEVARPDVAKASLMERIRTAVRDHVGVSVHEVVLVGRGSIPRTTSGKLRRAETRARLEQGTLQPPVAPPSGVLLRLAALSIVPVWLQRLVDWVTGKLNDTRIE